MRRQAGVSGSLSRACASDGAWAPCTNHHSTRSAQRPPRGSRHTRHRRGMLHHCRWCVRRSRSASASVCVGRSGTPTAGAGASLTNSGAKLEPRALGRRLPGQAAQKQGLDGSSGEWSCSGAVARAGQGERRGGCGRSGGPVGGWRGHAPGCASRRTRRPRARRPRAARRRRRRTPYRVSTGASSQGHCHVITELTSAPSACRTRLLGDTSRAQLAQWAAPHRHGAPCQATPLGGQRQRPGPATRGVCQP